MGRTEMQNAPLIAFANVGKSFDGGRVRAVDDVSLEVAEGEFLAIVGGSGSGKTTLLRLANRLINADIGSIAVDGEDVRAVEPVSLRRRIGYVFQSGGLFPHMSVADNIGITPKLIGFLPESMNCWIWCGSSVHNFAIAFRMSCRAASASASASPGLWQRGRASF